MNSLQKIDLPRRKEYMIICGVCIILLIVFMSDFFYRALSDWVMILTSCFCVFIFHISFRRISVSPSKICISLCRIPIRVIKRNRLSCVEVVRWQNTTTILFELEKCERYDISGFVSLSDYCALNCFRVIDYTVPRGQEEYVLSVLGSMYDLHFSDMSDKI